jgi:23S rRNA (cytidine1920-2'-O)/16S rRNA (cytidine1409-2'-O)-methyltransferase
MVRGMPATRPATLVSRDDPIVLAKDASRFVSRGGDKLDGALERLEVAVEGRRWLDVGASTGGFTDCLLQRGAAAVCAIDVGYGQLDWKLRNDDRVTVMERVNARNLVPDDLPWRAEGVVADVSFISLTLVLPAVVAAAGPDADYVLMVKPQFEVGKDAVGPGGVVRDPALWEAAIERVVEGAGQLGLGLAGAAASGLPGPAGNREFFVHLHRGSPGAPAATAAASAAVAAAIAEATA